MSDSSWCERQIQHYDTQPVLRGMVNQSINQAREDQMPGMKFKKNLEGTK
jgi:hypothetical protein